MEPSHRAGQSSRTQHGQFGGLNEVDEAIRSLNELAVRELIGQRKPISEISFIKICKAFPPLVSTMCVTYPELVRRCLAYVSRGNTPDGRVLVELVQHGADINAVGDDGNTVLERACKKGMINLVEQILGGLSDTSSRQRFVELPVEGSEKRIRRAKVDAKNLNSNIPSEYSLQRALILAWSAGHINIVRALLLHGADPNTVDERGLPILLVVAARGNEQLVKLLLDAGAKIDVVDHKGNTFLHAAIYGGNSSLLRTGLQYCNKEVKNEDGETPLLYAARRGNEPAVRMLLEAQANIHAVDYGGGSFLHAAIEGDHYDIITKALDSQGAEIKNKRGETALLYAARLGRDQVVTMLLKAGASAQAHDSDGNTFLHAAVLGGNLDIVRQALECCDKNEKNFDGMTPLLLAASKKKTNVARALLNVGIDVTVTDTEKNSFLHMAALGGDPDMIRMALRANCALEGKNADGQTALLVAASHGRLQAFETLVDAGASVSAVDDDGNGLVHMAARRSGVSFLETAHRMGLDINSRNISGETPLMIAAECGSEKVVKNLLKYGADTSLTDWEGNTFLHHAVVGGSPSIIHEALSYFGIDTMNRSGETPLQFWLRTHPKTEDIECFNYLMNENPDINLLGPRQLAVCMALMDEEQFVKYEPVFRRKVEVFNQLRKQTEDVQFFKKYFSRYVKVFSQRNQEVGSALRSPFQGRIRKLSSPEDFDVLKKELRDWLVELDRLRLLIRAKPLGYSKLVKLQVVDARRLCKLMLEAVGNQKYEILIAEDDSGVQAISILKLRPGDYLVKYLMTHPRNLPVRGSKRAVSRAPTSLLQQMARRVLIDGEKKFSLDSTHTAQSFYLSLGFSYGVQHDYEIEGKALETLAGEGSQ